MEGAHCGLARGLVHVADVVDLLVRGRDVCARMMRRGGEEKEEGRGGKRREEAIRRTHEDGHAADIECDVGDELHVGLARGFA